MTRGLVLSGGGSRGSFQIGALECLYKRFGYSADVIAGPSVGAVNGMGLAQGVGAAAQIAEIDKLLASGAPWTASSASLPPLSACREDVEHAG